MARCALMALYPLRAWTDLAARPEPGRRSAVCHYLTPDASRSAQLGRGAV